MSYTPINKARFEVRIKKGIMHDKHYYWVASVHGNTGISYIYSTFITGGNFPTVELAESDFLEFAAVNDIHDFIIFKSNS